MPALLTHYLMAEEALEHAQLQFESPKERQAYLLGAQGPDPYFFRTFTFDAHAAHLYAKSAHHNKIIEQFRAFYDALKLLKPNDVKLAKAYVYGFLAHYTLDSLAHPFVYANQFSLMDADDKLKGGANQVHAIIESDIDSSMLRRLRGYDVSLAYIKECLTLDDESLALIGRLHSYVAKRVYEIDLDYREFEHSVKDMRTIYQLIEGDNSLGFKLLSGLEKRIKNFSMLKALSHRQANAQSDSHLNLDKQSWSNPFTRRSSNTNFVEIFEHSVIEYKTKLTIFLSGNDYSELSKHLNYSGQILDENELYPLVHLKYE